MSTHSTAEFVAALPYTGPGRCMGCGRFDPMGTHFLDCVLKTPGDFVIDRSDNFVGVVEGPEELDDEEYEDDCDDHVI